MRSGNVWRLGLGAWILAALLSACGGGGGGASGSGPDGGTAATDGAGGVATIDATGGTVATADGVKVVVPAGAASAPVTIRVAKDSTGAPALPTTGLRAAGDIVAITPHGASFDADVAVSVPVPTNVVLADNERWALAKAEFGGNRWSVQPTTARDGMLQTTLRSFSFVVPVIQSFPNSLVSLPPLTLTVQVLCDGVTCPKTPSTSAAVPLPGTVTVSVTSNGGMAPSGCPSAARTPLTVTLYQSTGIQGVGVNGTSSVRADLFAAGGTQVVTFGPLLPMTTNLQVRIDQFCADETLVFDDWYYVFAWPSGYAGSNLVAIAAWPVALTAVAGQPAQLPATVVMQGVPEGAPTADLQALVNWERSDDAGRSWQAVAVSKETDGPPPLSVDMNHKVYGFWYAAHGFTPTSADHGSQWRATACWHDAAAAADRCSSSGPLKLTVVDSGAPPAYTQQPRDMLVTTGQTASFSAVADASNVLPVTAWQWQTRPANSSGAWSDIAGATSATYTSGVLAAADSGTQIRVVATNAAGSTPSDTVTVAVGDAAVAPSIGTQPLALSVVSGSDAVLAVAARGTEALSYQWLKNGSPISSSGNATATSPVLKLPATSAADAGDYSVRVSNAVGSVTSQAAHLGVSPGVPDAVAPSIVAAPANAAVHVGDSASFGVGVGGTGPFTYQWLRGGNPVTGATQAVLPLAAVTLADAGSYSVTVSNSAGSVTSAAASLSVAALGAPVAAPTITTDPATLTALPQTTAVFAVAASGSATLSYRWSFNGTPLADGNGISGSAGPVLTVSGITVAAAGSYRVQVSNAAGAAQSAAAALIVVGAPAVNTQPADASVTAGATAGFSVSASGSFLNYLWLKNGEPITGATGSSYTTPALALADSGNTYRVIVYNNAGVVFSRSATLTVTPAAPVNWLPHGPVADWQALAVARDGSRMAVAGIGTQIQVSADRGATWSAAGPVADWLSIAVSADGRRLVAGQSAGGLYASSDGGASWQPLVIPGQPARDWMGVAISADGNRILAVTPNIGLFVSSDGGSTWSRTLNTAYWTAAGMSADGALMAATANNGQIVTSSDGGLSWLARDSARQWSSVALSADGSRLVAAEYGGQIYTSTDRGVTWAPQLSSANWRSVAMSSDGSVLLAAAPGQGIDVSRDGGATWVLQGLATRLWTAVGLSADASLLGAAVSTGQIYTAP